MTEKLHLIALPFSTDDFLQFETVAKDHEVELDLDVPTKIATGQLLNELTRPEFKMHKGVGILISSHENRPKTELLKAITVLRRSGRQLYALSHGLIPLTPESLGETKGE